LCRRMFTETREMRGTPQEEEKVRLDDVEHVFVPFNHESVLNRQRKLRHLGERFGNARSYWAFVCADFFHSPEDVLVGE